jgi:hypothetical protein
MTSCPTPLSSQFELSLAHQGMFSLADAAGLQMTCREGSLWITLDNDTRDIVLSAGESFLTTQHRRAIIYAMGPSSLSLALAPVAQAARRSGKAGRTCSPRMLLSLQPA